MLDAPEPSNAALAEMFISACSLCSGDAETIAAVVSIGNRAPMKQRFEAQRFEFRRV